jgi:hypothetical protein
MAAGCIFVLGIEEGKWHFTGVELDFLPDTPCFTMRIINFSNPNTSIEK